MGIFDRVSTIFKANVNSALDKAEDPEKMLTQIITDMNTQLVKAKQGVAAAIADEKRLGKEYKNEVESAEEWEEKATVALEKNNEDLAKKALIRRNEHQQLVDDYKEQWEKQKAAVGQLKDHLLDLQRRIEEAQRKKNLLVARQKRAQAQKQIHDTISGMQKNDAFSTFDRMNAKVDEYEAKADAAAEMSAEFSGEDKLEAEFAALKTKSNVDDDLAALKTKVAEK